LNVLCTDFAVYISFTPLPPSPTSYSSSHSPPLISPLCYLISSIKSFTVPPPFPHPFSLLIFPLPTHFLLPPPFPSVYCRLILQLTPSFSTPTAPSFTHFHCRLTLQIACFLSTPPHSTNFHFSSLLPCPIPFLYRQI